MFQDVFHRIARAYALWRIKPTDVESRSYNHTDRVLLTFDDYAEDEVVRRLLEVLRANGVRAVFFLVGKWAEEHPDTVKAIADEGHWIGNHTYSHSRLVGLSTSMVKEEIQKGPSSKLLRPPYGVYDERIRGIAAELGCRIAYWTIDSGDWKGIGGDRIKQRVLGELKPGACILFHLHAEQTISSLPDLIRQIRARGLELCSDGTEISLPA